VVGLLQIEINTLGADSYCAKGGFKHIIRRATVFIYLIAQGAGALGFLNVAIYAGSA
jgi:hypothetical protein